MSQGPSHYSGCREERSGRRPVVSVLSAIVRVPTLSKMKASSATGVSGSAYNTSEQLSRLHPKP